MPDVTRLTLADILAASAGYVGFVAILFVGSLLLPGPVREGALRPDGTRQRYKLNGLALFVATLVLAAVAQLHGWSLAVILHVLPALALAANVFAFSAAFLLLGRSPQRHRLRDYLLGSQRDPTLLGIDLKLFSYRPSLIGLMLINLSTAAAELAERGHLSLAMALYQALFLVYIANYFQFERGMLFTWDITEERFGLMLIWGDYVLVPFFYCLPGLWLLFHPHDLAPTAALGVAALFCAGFWLFRGANQQKHRFRQNPDALIWGRRAETLGGRLLVSGFWGIGRKLNYTGEICIYTAFAMTAGFSSPVPYLVALWLGTLLVHRAWRDDKRCRAKYGTLWEAYCRRVRFRMVPFIY